MFPRFLRQVEVLPRQVPEKVVAAVKTEEVREMWQGKRSSLREFPSVPFGFQDFVEDFFDLKIKGFMMLHMMLNEGLLL